MANPEAPSANVPLAMAIMTRSDVRTARDDACAIAVFSKELSHILWASHEAARLLKLAATGPQPDGALENSAPVRQIRASRRMLAAGGQAKALVASTDRGMGAPLTARIDGVEIAGFGPAALVTIAGVKPVEGVSRDDALLLEAGPAALYGCDGHLVAEHSAAADHCGASSNDAPDIMQITAFADGAQALGTIETAGGAFAVGRVADNRLVVIRLSAPSQTIETSQTGKTSQTGETSHGNVDDADADDAGDRDADDREGERNRGLGALVERWYFRHQGITAAPSDAHDGAHSDRVPGGSMPGDDSSTGEARLPIDEADAVAARAVESPRNGEAGDRGSDEGQTTAHSGMPDQLAGGVPMTPGPQQIYGAKTLSSRAHDDLVKDMSADTFDERSAKASADASATGEQENTESLAIAEPTATETADVAATDDVGAEQASATPDRGKPVSSRQQDAASGPVAQATGGTEGSSQAAGDTTACERHDDGAAASSEILADQKGAGASPPHDKMTAEERPSDTATGDAGEADTESAKALFRPDFDRPAARFVWRIDADGRFRSVSPELASAVGPKLADIVDRPFADVARSFGIDADGEVAALLARRDTWSGRTVLWPVENAAKRVPVDLAALPVYSRDRAFDGFRGFGVVRLSDAVDMPTAFDAAASGPHGGEDRGDAPKSSGSASTSFAALPEAANNDDASPADHSTALSASEAMDILAMVSESAEPQFGRRDPTDRPTAPDDALPVDHGVDRSAGTEGPPAAQVIRLEERRGRRDPFLSKDEQAAFRAIGETLGDEEPEDGEHVARDARGDEERGVKAGGSAERATAPLEQAIRAAGRRIEAYERSSDETSDGPDEAAARGIAAVEQPHAHHVDTDEQDGAASDDDHNADGADGADGEHAAPSAHDEGHDATQNDGNAADDPKADPAADKALFDELSTVYGNLPLPVLVQLRETLIYGNREFFDLTGYEDIGALNDAGGLAHLYAEDVTGDGLPDDGGMAVSRANGETVGVRTHMQRSTINGRSCLVMSFFATPGASASAIRQASAALDVAATERGDDEAEHDEASVLRQTVEELYAVLAAATDGVVLLSPDGMIRSMNEPAHSLFGIARDDAGGRPFVTLFAHESQKAAADYLDMLRSGQGHVPAGEGREVIGRVAEGGFVPLQVNLGRLPGTSGWCAVIRDISRRKGVEEELTNARRTAEAASLHKSHFLANVSHELRTPLNAIIGFADVIATECFGPIGNERYLEYLDDIKRSGHHVLDLVNDLLDISKIEAGKLDLTFEAVPLNEVLSEIVALMQPQANRERVLVRSNLPTSVPPVVADRRSIRQIALNLVANAIRFTPAGGQIIVSTSCTADGAVYLRFRDSGIGMSDDEIEIAMKPFEQVGPTQRTRGEGTGLGLPLTKALVEANRAEFSLASTPGEGTLVEILFPPQRVLSD